MKNIRKYLYRSVFLTIVLLTLISIRSERLESQIEYSCDDADTTCLTIGDKITVRGENPRVIIR